MTCGDVVEAHPDHTVEDLKQSLLTCCCVSPAVPPWGAPVEQKGHGGGKEACHPGGGAGGCRGGLTKWGGQGLLAEDLLVQLFCLLILVLLQVG